MPAPTTILRRFLLWAVVCAVSAAPSFVLAPKKFDRGAMATGVALFVLAYTALTSTASFERFHGLPFMRRTLRIGYGVRLAVSILYPVGMVVDMLPGLLSMAIVARLAGRADSFAGTLSTTVVQGVWLNLLLGVFMACVYAVQKLFVPPPQAPHGFEVVVPAIPVGPA